ncbi:hypothetical protein Tco_0413619 [Tanacetum coccineum]
MSGTIPPIPPPFGTSSGNPGSPNVNRVDTMPTTTDPINTTTTTNVSQSVVDENLPQLLDSRGGSHVTNVPAFDKEDFTSWKVRFLVFLDGLEPYLLKTLKDEPFVPMSSLSTSKNSLPKRQNQWSNVESRLANQVNETFTRLKRLLNDQENNGVTIPQAEVNAMFVNSLLRKWLSMNQTQRANNSIKNDSLATLSKALVSNHQFQDSDSDVEEDQTTINEFMADLNAEYHERALLANQQRFYKRSGRNSGNHQKEYKGKYKGLKAEMVVLTKRIDDITKEKNDEGSTKIRAFMAIAEDEPSVGKADARSNGLILP